jgi:hypothetical protein
MPDWVLISFWIHCMSQIGLDFDYFSRVSIECSRI